MGHYDLPDPVEVKRKRKKYMSTVKKKQPSRAKSKAVAVPSNGKSAEVQLVIPEHMFRVIARASALSGIAPQVIILSCLAMDTARESTRLKSDFKE
jgi:hypothetical protein